MVFGLFEGGIDLVVDKLNYSFVEKINGKILMKLKESKQGKALWLHFWGEYETFNVNKKGEREQKLIKIQQTSLQISGEKHYFNEEYPFEFVIPPSPFSSQNPQQLTGVLKNVVGVMQAFTPSNPRTVRWFLQAQLDVPMSVDFRKQVQLNIV